MVCQDTDENVNGEIAAKDGSGFCYLDFHSVKVGASGTCYLQGHQTFPGLR